MTSPDQTERVRGCLPLMVVAGFGVLLLFALGFGDQTVSTMPRPFDSEIWKRGAGNVHCDMVADLKRRVGVVRRTRTDLYGLLGKPDDEAGSDPNLSHWHLCPSFMDIWILEVRWRDNVVVSAKVRDT